MRGAKALARYNDVDANIKIRLECLGAHTIQFVGRLIDHLFAVSIDSFRPGGTLHVVLRTAAASLIMHHRSVTLRYTPANAVATKLRTAAREAGILDARYPTESPEYILDRWSRTISDDFHERNPEIADAEPTLVSMATLLNQQTKLMLGMKADIGELKRDKVAVEQKATLQEQQITYLQNETASLQQQLVSANGKLGMLRTPP